MPNEIFSRPITTDLLPLNQRQPPLAENAETGLLGTLLANNRAYDRICEIVEPKHFAYGVNGRIYASISRRIEGGGAADGVTMVAEFEADPDLLEGGGSAAAYIAGLLSSFVSMLHAKSYAEMVVDAWRRRQIIIACTDATDRSYDRSQGAESAAIVEELDASLLDLRDVTGRNALQDSDAVSRICDAQIRERIANPNGIPGIPTGLNLVDRKLRGLNPGKVYILAGRPGMGKTAIAGRIVAGAAELGANCLVVTAEMPPEDIMDRQIAGLAGVPIGAVQNGEIELPNGSTIPLSRDVIRRIGDATFRLSHLPITWWDAAAPTVSAIRARCLQLKRKGKLDLVVIDYLQLLRGTDPKANLYTKVTECSGDIMAMAKDLGVPVLLLSQLSRGVEGREGAVPRMSDLRDSGAIEQDAFAIMLLHREHYYLTQANARPRQKAGESAGDFASRLGEWQQRCIDTKGRATLDIAKNRGGRVGEVELAFIDESVWFDNLNPQDDTYGA